MESIGISLPDGDLDFLKLYAYWIPILQTNPCEQHYIAGSAKALTNSNENPYSSKRRPSEILQHRKLQRASVKRVLTIYSNVSAPLNKMGVMTIYGKNT